MNAFSFGPVAILAGSPVLPAQDGPLKTVSQEHWNSYHVLGRTLRFVVKDSLLSTTPQWTRPDAGCTTASEKGHKHRPGGASEVRG